jgi:hypothetical protein
LLRKLRRLNPANIRHHQFVRQVIEEELVELHTGGTRRPVHLKPRFVANLPAPLTFDKVIRGWIDLRIMVQDVLNTKGDFCIGRTHC